MGSRVRLLLLLLQGLVVTAVEVQGLVVTAVEVQGLVVTAVEVPRPGGGPARGLGAGQGRLVTAVVADRELRSAY
jgi:hypothetical protein